MMFSKEAMCKLRNTVKNELSESRYKHTIGVVAAALMLSEFCLPELSSELEVAALLHDISKEYTMEKQLKIINDNAILLNSEDLESSAVLHSYTAKYVVENFYKDFATPNVLSSVYNHTLGAPNMSVFDEIIFLADFIEENRKYESSIEVRKYVFENMKRGNLENNIRILHLACIKSIDFTISHLVKNKIKVNTKNILTRNALLSKI